MQGHLTIALSTLLGWPTRRMRWLTASGTRSVESWGWSGQTARLLRWQVRCMTVLHDVLSCQHTTSTHNTIDASLQITSRVDIWKHGLHWCSEPNPEMGLLPHLSMRSTCIDQEVSVKVAVQPDCRNGLPLPAYQEILSCTENIAAELVTT